MGEGVGDGGVDDDRNSCVGVSGLSFLDCFASLCNSDELPIVKYLQLWLVFEPHASQSLTSWDACGHFALFLRWLEIIP